mgnify:FL=1
MDRRIGLCFLAVAFLILVGAVHTASHAAGHSTNSKMNGAAHNHELLDAQYDEAVDFVRQKKYDEAYASFLALSKHGQHDAQYNLATLLKAGLGHPQDFQQALYWAWLSQLGDVKKAPALAEDLIGLMPENALDAIRDKVVAHLTNRVDDGDHPAIMQRGDFFLEVTAEADYEQAYIWYAIGAAMRLDNAFQARNAAAEELDPEVLVDLQEEAAQIFQELKARENAAEMEARQS